MNARRKALASVITIFGLLLFSFASFVKQMNPEFLAELQVASKHYYADSAGPASATAYLAEFKPRFIAFVSSCFSNLLSLSPSFTKIANSQTKVSYQFIANARPLWLVHRALLI
jgi:hypothetical protein